MASSSFPMRPLFMITSTMEKTVHEIRKQFEARTIDQNLLAQLYQEYSDVGDTIKFIAKARDIFPRGNCGLASLYLRKELGGRIVRGKYGRHRHTFLLIDDTVVDITTDQFGGPKVYIGPLQSPWSPREK